MKQRLEAWSGNVQGIWEGVKGVARRESVVYRCIYDDNQQARCNGALNEDSPSSVIVLPAVSPSQRVEVVKPRTTKVDRERVRLHAQLDKISTRRDELKDDENIVVLREQMWDLASRRAEQRGDCGFDMRMCWADDEVREYGEEVFASYDAEEDAREGRDEDRMAVDGAADQDSGEWWCKGKKKCERHAGCVEPSLILLAPLIFCFSSAGRNSDKPRSNSAASLLRRSWIDSPLVNETSGNVLRTATTRHATPCQTSMHRSEILDLCNLLTGPRKILSA